MAPLTTFGVIRDLAVISADDAWAVGDTSQQTGPLQFTGGPQLWHWDGAAWTLVAPPGPGGGLLAVAALASNDVWAAGSKVIAGPDGFVGGQLWVIHYDGSQWSEVQAPLLPSGVTGALVRDIEALASDDIWFVGDWLNPAGCDPGLAMHWNGSTFTIHPTPCAELPVSTDGFGLEAVSAIDSDDIWAVGGGGDGDYYYTPVYIIHWDGSSWTHYEHQTPGFGHRLWAVEALASDDVWASGDYFDAFGYHAYAVHWDGQAWTFMDIPGGGRHLWSSGNGILYAAGAGVFRFDGSSWEWADDLGILIGEDAGVSLLALEGTGECELFAVGRHIELGAIKPYAARVELPGLWTASPRAACSVAAFAESMYVQSGAKLGATASMGFDDPQTQYGLLPGFSKAIWFWSLAPTIQSPCGPLLFGFGLIGQPGEMLINPSSLVISQPTSGAWNGPGLPAVASVALPNAPGLVGLPIYTQGLWITPGVPQPTLLTNAIDLELGH